MPPAPLWRPPDRVRSRSPSAPPARPVRAAARLLRRNAAPGCGWPCARCPSIVTSENSGRHADVEAVLADVSTGDRDRLDRLIEGSRSDYLHVAVIALAQDACDCAGDAVRHRFGRHFQVVAHVSTTPCCTCFFGLTQSRTDQAIGLQLPTNPSPDGCTHLCITCGRPRPEDPSCSRAPGDRPRRPRRRALQIRQFPGEASSASITSRSAVSAAASASASGSFGANTSRMRSESSSAMSGLSVRKSLTFSRPCPRCSPS